MRILVTGGGGYVGAVLVPLLLERGDQVVLFDRFLWGIKPILHFASHPNLEIVTGDIRDEQGLRHTVDGCEAVLHLAAIVGYPACAADTQLAHSTNVDGTAAVLKAADKRRVVFASTGSTYGKVDGICTEETPIAPLTVYGSTKWTAERMVLDAGGTALRFATVFGISPRLRLDLLVNDFVHQAVHNKQIVLYEGHFRRTFLHVRDAAAAYPFALDHWDQMAGQAFNVGDESMNYSKREIALRVKQFLDYYLHEADVGEDLDKRDYEVSYSKLRALGFGVRVKLDEGIRELIKVLQHVQIRNEWRNA